MSKHLWKQKAATDPVIMRPAATFYLETICAVFPFFCFGVFMMLRMADVTGEEMWQADFYPAVFFKIILVNEIRVLFFWSDWIIELQV